MKKVILSLFAVSTIMMVSCGGSDSPEKDSSLTSTDSTNKSVITTTAGDSVKPVIVNAPGGATPNIITSTQPGPTMQTVTQAATAVTAKGMNPAHGQPGHRCDISVGAPLNSAPAAKTSPAVQTSTTTSTPAMPAVTAPPAIISGSTGKLNPAHGQPGHDCAVAVGAPLKN